MLLLTLVPVRDALWRARYCPECRCFESTVGGGKGVGCYEHTCEVDGSVTVTASSGASVSCGPGDAGATKTFAGLSGTLQCPAVATLCPAPSCFDGVQNGDEEEVDCGGSDCNEFCRVHSIDVSGSAFTPAALAAARGDYVRFEWSTGVHNVVESASVGSCSAAANAFSSGSPAPSGLFVRRFEFNGVHPFHCEVHCGSGMQGASVRGRPRRLQGPPTQR